MSLLIALWLALSVPDADVRAFRATAPAELSYAGAAVNLAAAREAGNANGIAPEYLLSIALHESRYQFRTRTPETRHRFSCGVMTPEPKPDCSEQDFEPLGGYEAGAAHLHRWLAGTPCNGDIKCALTGYAGGYYLISLCSSDPTSTACAVTDFMLQHAALIRNSLSQKRYHAHR